jgi:hypothetical protein
LEPPLPDTLNPLMLGGPGEYANTAEDADALDRDIELEYRIRNGDQFANQQDAFRRGMLNFLGVDQSLARTFRGAPFVTDDETARW